MDDSPDGQIDIDLHRRDVTVGPDSPVVARLGQKIVQGSGGLLAYASFLSILLLSSLSLLLFKAGRLDAGATLSGLITEAGDTGLVWTDPQVRQI